MKLVEVKFKDIKPEGQYIIKYDGEGNGMDVQNGTQTISDILDHFTMDEDDVEEYGGLEEAFEACDGRMGDGWDYLEVYEVIS
jgi:hypothetical protein